jgi:tRNA A-37 threonylcarbamoyl transferase component Bud32
MRKLARAAALVAAVAAVAAGAGALYEARAQAERVERARAEVEATAAEAAADLEAAGRALETEAARAAAVPQLGNALRSTVDSTTILDLFDNEDWWAPFRARLAAVVVGSEILAKRGPEADALAARGLLDQARELGRAGDWVGGERPVRAAAAVVEARRPGPPAFIVLGRPIAELLERARRPALSGGLLVTDGARVVARWGHAGAGSDAPDAAAAALAGRERESAVVAGSLVAAPRPIGQGLWLWAAARVEANTTDRVLGAVALLFGALAVVLGIRRDRTAGRRRSVAEAATARSGVAAGSAPPSVAAAPTPTPAPAPGASPPAAAAAPPATMLSEGQTFGRYRLLQRLGEGGMAELFLAVLSGPEGFERRFVIKRLKPELAANRTAVDQFIDEAKLGSRLVRSNIVPVLDFGRVGEGYFLAQEYIVGRNLDQVLTRHLERSGAPLPPRLAFHIAHETLQALAYAHARRNDRGEPLLLVHRDVSTSNVMVSHAGEVKLLDFGIAKAAERVSRTDFGSVKGNAAFMSPEQARGQPVDARSDLFALGLVLWTALTGKLFYAGQGHAELCYLAGTGPTEADLARLEELPSPAPAVLRRALATDPAARYQDAEAFAADLKPHVAGAEAQLAALMATLFGSELESPAAPGSSAAGSASARVS